MKCTKCQAEIPEGTKTCTACGEPAAQDNHETEALSAENGAAVDGTAAAQDEAAIEGVPGEAGEAETVAVAEAPAAAEVAAVEAAAPAAEAAAPAAEAPAAEAAAPAAEAAAAAEAVEPAAKAAASPAAPPAENESPGVSAAEPAAAEAQVTMNTAEAAVPVSPEVREAVPSAQPADPTAAPEGPAGGGSGKGGKNFIKVIVAVIVAIAVISVAALAAVKLTAKNPKDVVITAFENIHPKGEVLPNEELFGTSQFIKNAQKTSAEGGLTLKLSDSSEPFISQYNGSGIRIEGKENKETKESSANFGIIYNHMDLLNLDAYYGNKKAVVAIPELSGKAFTLDLSKDLAQQVKDSPVFGPMAKESGIDPDDISAYLKELQDQLETREAQQPFDLDALMKRFKEGSKAEDNFKAALTVTKDDQKQFTMDGKQVSCRGYKTLISKTAMIDFLNSSSDFFLKDDQFRQDFLNQLKLSVKMSELMGGSMSGISAESLTDQTYDQAEKSVEQMITYLDKSLDDVNMTVYVDKKGRLAAVEGTTVIHADDVDLDVKFNFELMGGTYLTQNVDGTIEVTDGEVTATATVHRQGAFDGKELTDKVTAEVEVTDERKSGFSYTSKYTKDSGEYKVGFKLYDEGEDIVDISLKGVVDELEKGKTFHTAIDELKISAIGDEKSVSLEGEYYYRPLEGSITAPKGDVMDIMTATSDDWDDVASELYENTFALLMKLQ